MNRFVLAIAAASCLCGAACGEKADAAPGIFDRGGSMFLGCNYWASHAGVYMWREWRPDVVEHERKSKIVKLQVLVRLCDGGHFGKIT